LHWKETEMTEIVPPLDVRGFDHVEIWVGNARQSAHFYASAFGFSERAYAGPETGVKDRASHLLVQGKIRLLLTAPILPDGPVASFIHKHGDGVKNVAFEVGDAEKAYDEAIRRGAVGIDPRSIKTESGIVRRAVGVRRIPSCSEDLRDLPAGLRRDRESPRRDRPPEGRSHRC
jgi:4-hydroxyphenylpyruvate dioxygenase